MDERGELTKNLNSQEGAVEGKRIEVSMSEMKIAKAPEILITRGLGSCLGITIYDSIKKIGAMAHPMLPDIDKAKIKSSPLRFVNSVIDKMIEGLQKQGCLKRNLVAKLFGGAHMFSFISQDSVLNVGERNIDIAKLVLQKHGIKIAAEELRGSIGRTIELHLENGKVYIKTISSGDKEV